MTREDTLKVVHLPNGGRIEFFTDYLELDWFEFHDSYYGYMNFRDTFDEKGNHVRRLTNGWWWEKEYDDQGRKIYQLNSNGDEFFYKYKETEFGFETQRIII